MHSRIVTISLVRATNTLAQSNIADHIYVQPRPLALGNIIPISEFIYAYGCGSRTWCPQAYRPPALVSTPTQARGAGKHTPLQSHICWEAHSIPTRNLLLLILLHFAYNNIQEVVAESLLRATFPSRLHMPLVHMGSDPLGIDLSLVLRTIFVPMMALSQAPYGYRFHRLKGKPVLLDLLNR